MKEQIMNILIALALAGICGLLAMVLKANKKAIKQFVLDQIQKAETAIQGSGLGADKKALVIAQLEAAGVNAGKWVDKTIDDIVAALNKKNAWYCDQAKDTE